MRKPGANARGKSSLEILKRADRHPAVLRSDADMRALPQNRNAQLGQIRDVLEK